jgi:NAD-dependent deacetylase
MNPEDVLAAARRLKNAQLLVVLTGAGVAKESGVPTFRDALDGLWAHYDPQQLATPAAFQANPKLVWDWYAYRRQMIEGVKPNPGHLAISELEKLLPQVVVVTQNIDGLHHDAGSTDIIELHGNIRRYKCFYECRGKPTLIDLNTLDWNRDAGPPACPYCGRWVRPDVVWFTEVLPDEAIHRAQELSRQADVMLVVGTSGVVYPAAALPGMAKEYGAYIIDVNPVRDEISTIADLFLDGPSGEVLPQIVQALREIA